MLFFFYFTLYLISNVYLKSISTGLKLWQVNHNSIYEKCAWKVFKNTKVISKISNTWPKHLSGRNMNKTLESWILPDEKAIIFAASLLISDCNLCFHNNFFFSGKYNTFLLGIYKIFFGGDLVDWV